jgi:hypothetical protein
MNLVRIDLVRIDLVRIDLVRIDLVWIVRAYVCVLLESILHSEYIYFQISLRDLCAHYSNHIPILQYGT